MKPCPSTTEGQGWEASFQFLWGWNLIPFFNRILSMPSPFQFLWGWNLNYLRSHDNGNNFQFLWGWNGVPVCRRAVFVVLSFQFLWGWNKKWERVSIMLTYLSIPLRMERNNDLLMLLRRENTFNSFEDETRILCSSLLRTMLWTFNSFEDETRWSWRRQSIWGGITFNSFEDETLSAVGRQRLWSLSFNSFVDETDLLLFSLLYTRG